MKEKVFTITAEAGLHARPATLLVQAVGRYSSEIHLEYKERSVNLKSIMGVMSLGVPHKAEIKITVDGHDEEEAMQGIIDTMKKEGLGE
ncbi:phosphocarrier protein HPr [Bacillus horti]|uniref:Phosphocarrier protein HPr n=1 Tax=Caldalkalibacillus horti TaxID=77523 RepID=A0ABT9W337_9BACI|nr:phosphocarrier protein HPr [Bacillus horti]MDQ0167654.1 phosphocarrier protein [Bacillus horti]